MFIARYVTVQLFTALNIDILISSEDDEAESVPAPKVKVGTPAGKKRKPNEDEESVILTEFKTFDSDAVNTFYRVFKRFHKYRIKTKDSDDE